MPGDILGLIDGALSDWSASEDAMRWRPEGGEHEGAPVFLDGLGNPLNGAVTFAPMAAPRWTAIGPVERADGVDEWTVFVTRDEIRQAEGLHGGGGASWYAIDLAARPFAGPLEASATFQLRPEGDELERWIAGAFGFAWKDGALHYHAAGAPPRVLRRCPLCSPRTGPRRLPIDGHAYARRRAARKRR